MPSLESFSLNDNLMTWKEKHNRLTEYINSIEYANPTILDIKSTTATIYRLSSTMATFTKSDYGLYIDNALQSASTWDFCTSSGSVVTKNATHIKLYNSILAGKSLKLMYDDIEKGTPNKFVTSENVRAKMNEIEDEALIYTLVLG